MWRSNYRQNRNPKLPLKSIDSNILLNIVKKIIFLKLNFKISKLTVRKKTRNYTGHTWKYGTKCVPYNFYRNNNLGKYGTYGHPILIIICYNSFLKTTSLESTSRICQRKQVIFYESSRRMSKWKVFSNMMKCR